MKKQSDHSLATKKQNIIYTYIFFYLWMHFCFCVSVASKKEKQNNPQLDWDYAQAYKRKTMSALKKLQCSDK